MKIVAVKMTSDPESTKILYEKNGSVYIRNGEDGFEKGVKPTAPMSSLINKWGFRKVENPPSFRDAEEIVDNLSKLSVTNRGTIRYS